MMIADEEGKAEKDVLRTYTYGGLPWVPHYNDEGVFVCPGGATMSEQELTLRGAKMKAAALWPRAWKVRARSLQNLPPRAIREILQGKAIRLRASENAGK